MPRDLLRELIKAPAVERSNFSNGHAAKLARRCSIKQLSSIFGACQFDSADAPYWTAETMQADVYNSCVPLQKKLKLKKQPLDHKRFPAQRLPACKRALSTLQYEIQNVKALYKMIKLDSENDESGFFYQLLAAKKDSCEGGKRLFNNYLLTSGTGIDVRVTVTEAVDMMSFAWRYSQYGIYNTKLLKKNGLKFEEYAMADDQLQVTYHMSDGEITNFIVKTNDDVDNSSKNNSDGEELEELPCKFQYNEKIMNLR
ncbi:hypothetical protein T4D_12257 [Trichinella pseudospiralis]|uniref:Uncharacterized protein n=1 Tax=Trichinella pseudospiralis TaxID=6337 RepID=A0A0V1FE32_TRIPS|nr:hypothetical protein T4D_12257 [Trichinella pseudospiralis]